MPLLLWEGYTGARALQLIHSLVWNDTAPEDQAASELARVLRWDVRLLAAISLTWWYRDATLARQLVVFAVMIVPLAALWLWVSWRLPHGTASWKALLPGALLVAVGFQIVHGMVVWLLGPKLEHAASLYGGLGVVATILFFMWAVGRIVVTAPILNSSLHDELKGRHPDDKALAALTALGE